MATQGESGGFYIGSDEHHEHHEVGADAQDSHQVALALAEMNPLFCELEMLERSPRDGNLRWKEAARWVKFEENVEEGGGRWSKPYVASLSYAAVRQLKKELQDGMILLDAKIQTVHELAGLITEELKSKKEMEESELQAISDVLIGQHKHKLERRPSLIPKKGGGRRGSLPGRRGSMPNPSDVALARPETATSLSSEHSTEFGPSKRNQSFMRKLPQNALAANILVGALEDIKQTVTAFVRLQEPHIIGEFTEVTLPTKFMFIHIVPGNDEQHGKNIKDLGRCMGAMLADGEFRGVAYRSTSGEDLLKGIERFLDDSIILPPGEWDPKIRIEPPSKVPTRLPPPPEPSPEEKPLLDSKPSEEPEEEHGMDPTLNRTGRLFGGLWNDIKRKLRWYPSDFRDALHIQCVASVIFIYIAALTPIITFGGLLGKATHNYMAAMEGILAGAICGTTYALFAGQPLTIVGSTGPMLVFESILYNFCEDRGWSFMSFRIWVGIWVTVLLLLIVMFDLSFLVRYITRFTEEGFASLISIIFIYEAVTKLLKMEQYYGVNKTPRDPDSKICHCYVPPPTVAPTVNTSMNHTGTASAYNFVISTVASLGNTTNATDVDDRWQPNTTFRIDYWERDKCTKYHHGTLIGHGCYYVSDVFLFSVLLFLGTFVISYGLKAFKTSAYFPSKVREIVSDFAVIIGVIAMTMTDMFTGIDTPKLNVPEQFKPTRDDRGWFISPFVPNNPWWLIPLALIPAILATVLIFLDQQITAVIVNRKENKLKKGAGYHLDLFVIAIQITVCVFLGLPWFVAATVRAMTHVNSLRKESEASAPGERPEFLGIRENRVTNFLVSLLIGLSVPLTVVFRRIPMPVLYGVFMYMGISSLRGIQFVDRLSILFMPAKYQPDYSYLRTVKTWRVHLFTFIQVCCMVAMWVFKATKSIAIAFPLLVLAMCFVRKAMERIFTIREMRELDNVLPVKTVKKKDEEQGESTDKELEAMNGAKALIRKRFNQDGTLKV